MERGMIYARAKIGQGMTYIHSWEITWYKKLAGISKLFGKLFEEHRRAILVQSKASAKLMSKRKSFGRSSPFDSKLCHKTFNHHVVKDMEYLA
ncbi:hypothetical protein Tco_0275557 [Tanacetum coccineum]